MYFWRTKFCYFRFHNLCISNALKSHYFSYFPLFLHTILSITRVLYYSSMALTVFSLFFFFLSFTFHLPSCFSGTSLTSISDSRFLRKTLFQLSFLSLIAFPFRRAIELHGISAWSSEHYVRFHRRLSLRAPDESLWHHRLFKWVSSLSHSLSIVDYFAIFKD